MAFCTSCGKELPANAQYCPSCGANFRANNLQTTQDTQQVQQGPQPMPQGRSNYQMNVPNHLVKAIIVTLCCCQPMGIVSIVFAAQVDSKLQRGDFDGAVHASKKANAFANWAIALGVLLYIVSIAANIIADTSTY